MTTGQKVLVVAGIGVGGYILWKMVSPAPTLVSKKPATGNIPTNLLTEAGAFFGGLLSGANPKSGPVSVGAPTQTTWYQDPTGPYAVTDGTFNGTSGAYTGTRASVPSDTTGGAGGTPDAQGSDAFGTNGAVADGAGDTLIYPSSYS